MIQEYSRHNPSDSSEPNHPTQLEKESAHNVLGDARWPLSFRCGLKYVHEHCFNTHLLTRTFKAAFIGTNANAFAPKHTGNSVVYPFACARPTDMNELLVDFFN